MKRFLVLALALVMAICSLAMTGCGKKEGVSFEDFSAKAQELEAKDPVLTKGTAWFKFSGDDDFGPDIDFEFSEEGELTYSKANFKWYAESVYQIIDNNFNIAIGGYCGVWDITEVQEKDDKTDAGEFKVTAIYHIENELSVKVVDYMKTAKGNEAESISYKKYDAQTGYLIEYYTKSNSGTEVTMKIEWDAE